MHLLTLQTLKNLWKIIVESPPRTFHSWRSLSTSHSDPHFSPLLSRHQTEHETAIVDDKLSIFLFHSTTWTAPSEKWRLDINLISDNFGVRAEWGLEARHNVIIFRIYRKCFITLFVTLFNLSEFSFPLLPLRSFLYLIFFFVIAFVILKYCCADFALKLPRDFHWRKKIPILINKSYQKTNWRDSCIDFNHWNYSRRIKCYATLKINEKFACCSFLLFLTFQVNISNTWTLPQPGFNVFYRYFRDKISWFEADAVCQFHHANLVTGN